jgi:hyperosmotically inducible periplasmic protein
VRDRNDATMTPPDQGNDEADLKRTADIRKRIVDAKLSSDATNVKVVTLNGRVTLRGPVKSQAEKDDVLRIAREVAGDANVDDQIEIESPTKR